MSGKIGESDRDAVIRSGGSHGSKRPLLAVVLNCLLPGLGLAYLSRWPLAIANFLVVQLVVVACFVIREPTIMAHIHWVLLILIVGSGALAHAAAQWTK